MPLCCATISYQPDVKTLDAAPHRRVKEGVCFSCRKMGRLRERGLKPMSDIKDRVKDILAEECAVDRAALTDDARLDDVGISSVDMVQVIFAIEEEYSISIGDGDIGLEIETVGEVTDAVAKIVADAKAGA